MKINSIAVDFDGTLCTAAYPEVGKRYWIHKLVAGYVRWMHKRGCIIIINTLRDVENDLVGKKPYLDCILSLHKWGIQYHYINMNIPEATANYGYARKINADRYIDDRNIGLIGWLLRLYSRKRK